MISYANRLLDVVYLIDKYESGINLLIKLSARDQKRLFLKMSNYSFNAFIGIFLFVKSWCTSLKKKTAYVSTPLHKLMDDHFI